MRWLVRGLILVGALGASLPVCAQDEVAAVPAPGEATPPPIDEALPTETPAATPEPTPEPARPPKVAIVIAGDPDPTTIAAATSLETVLASEAGVTMPSDPAMRAALRGEGTGDGLDDVRSERRRLGLGEARDITVLTILGELASADLVLVVRASHGTPSATAFDVLRRSFYDGVIALSPIDDAEARHFIVRRARRAARPLTESEMTATPPPEPPPVVDPATAVPPEAIAPDATPEHQPDFFEQYWPYFAAGALLVGAVVFIVLATQNSSTPPPVLRFEAGQI